MADFKGLLTELAKGRGNLEAARAFIDEAMVSGTADPTDLMGAIDGAGLPGPVAGLLKKQVSKYTTSADDPNKTVMDLGMSLEPSPAQEKTQMTAPHTGGESDPFAISDSDAKTQVVDDGPGDRTLVMDSDRTVVQDSDRTNQGGPAGEFDPFAADSMRTQQPSGGTGGTAWPGRGTGGVQKTIGPGTILKDRFELVSPLGEGGMGIVYKARDLLKVEAKDKNPYIAVKLLSGDFRNHPESFIALQRESSKAQRLAHPNIATVFDFDRDSGTVYMTMEVLEGQELAKYIKKLPPGGLPVDEAMKIIHQLCDGLAYAHEKGLVHSDFKPGNAFILNDGNVKIMDFGIARASKTKADAAGETTVFDPGQLGALTPAYATIEMFEGMDPEPPDDIYALACVAYELLAGKHPFNKLSAPKVLEKGLSPAPIVKPGWTKRQNRGLMKGLALKRENRTQQTIQFWEDIRPKKDYTLQIAGGSVALALLLGFALFTPIRNGLEDRRDDQIIQSIKDGGAAVIPGVLTQLPEYSARSQFNILDKAKEPIIGYFEQQAQAQADYKSEKFNYAAGLKIIDDARQYYPDSAKLESIKALLEADRANLINSLDAEFTQFLNSKQNLLAAADTRDMIDVLETLKMVKPDHPLISDARLMQEYGKLAAQAVQQKEFARADGILKSALAFAPKDATLLGINDGVQRELKRQADTQLVADVKKRLTDQRAGLTTLDAYSKAREDLLKLDELRPDDPLLAELIKPLAVAIDTGLNAAIAGKQWEQAEKVLFDYARLFTIPDLLLRRDVLSKAEVNAGWAPTNQTSQNALVEQRQKAIKDALAAAEFDATMDAALQKNFKELGALMRPGNTWFEDLRSQIVSAYLGQAGKFADADRFDAARRVLDDGERFAPGLDRFARTRADVATAEREYESERAQELLVAAITQDKATMMNAAKGLDTVKAEQLFLALRDKLPPNDEWLRGEGLNALGSAFASRAKVAKERGQADMAAQLIEKGLTYTPQMKELKDMQGGMVNELKKSAVLTLASSATPQSVRGLPERLNAARSAFPQEAASIQADVIGRLSRRIKEYEQTDPGAANELWAVAKELFPNDGSLRNLAVRSVPKPSVFAPRIRELIAASKLTEASNSLADAKTREPNNEDLQLVERDLGKRKSDAQSAFVQYRTFMSQNNRPGAQSALGEALRRWNDSPEFLDEQKKNFAVTTAPVKSADGSRACAASLKGFGKSGRAECFDMPGGQKGPTLVVVPEGGAFAAPFVISKFEISVGEYNTGCRASGKCTPLSAEANLPATGMSLEHAKAYAAWLAESTGKPYRIASEAEWVYAATAAGSTLAGTAMKDFNCRVMQGDQVLKGLSLQDIKTGSANGWGLTNFIGNAQEFVLKGGGAALRGGAFSDSLSTCTIDLVKGSNGAADPTVSFRLSRDID